MPTIFDRTMMNDELHTENPELDALFERYRQSPEGHVFAPLADACRKAGMLEEAIEICEKGVSANPTYPSGFVVRGKCYYDIGSADQAEASFEKVLEMDPNNLVALKYLGLILAERGQAREARERFEHILGLDPDDREISTWLAELTDAQDAGVSIGDELEDEIVEVLADEPIDDDAPRPASAAGGETDSGAGDDDRDDAAEPVELREVEDETFVGADITLGDGGQSPDTLATLTLADIYASQGYREKAIRIYRELLEVAPDNREVREKLRTLGVPGPDTADGEPADPAAEDTDTPPAEAPRPPRPDPAASERSASHFRRWLDNLKR